MQTSRRSVLKAGGGIVALGVSGLAGCSGLLGGGEEPGPAEYRYDPSVLAETENKFLGIVDYAGLYEQRENFPESTRKSFESSEDSPVDPEDVDTLTGVGGAQITVGESTSTSVFGSVVVLGSFEKSAVEQSLQDEGAQQSGEYEGFTLYENVESASPDEVGTSEASATVAVRDGVVIAGVAGTEGDATATVTSEQAARTTVDAGNGDVERLAAASERAGELTDRLGESSLMVGGQIDPSLIDLATQLGENSMATQFVDGLRAGGFGMTVDGETTTMTLLALYEDAETAENSGVTELVDLTAQSVVEETKGVDSIESEYDGNAAVVTIEGNTRTIFEEGSSAGSGGGFSITGPGTVGAVDRTAVSALDRTAVDAVDRIVGGAVDRTDGVAFGQTAASAVTPITGGAGFVPEP